MGLPAARIPDPGRVVPWPLNRYSHLCVALGALLLAFAGCGGQAKTYPVEGKVVYEDGAAVNGGTVEFMAAMPDGKTPNAHGTINEQGEFILGTFADGDGAVAGEHRAVVLQPVTMARGDLTKIRLPKGVDQRFASYETSGLKFEVKPEKNHIDIKVSKEK
jgi:hypothetical protein